jgi:hypothetical protein
MGGAAGHMLHLSENLDLTFSEIKQILLNVATAKLELVEKVDGQNIFFTWSSSSDAVLTARNSGDISKGGMTPEDFYSKWSGHPAESAFIQGFEAINNALRKMQKREKEEIFGKDSKLWVNAEIMFSGHPNVIQYDGNHIVIHGLHNPHAEGADDSDTSGKLQKLITSISKEEVEASKSFWKLHGPKIVKLKDISDGKHYDKLASDLDRLSGGRDNMSLKDYVAEQLRIGVVGSLSLRVDKQEDLITRVLGLANREPTENFVDIKDLKRGLNPSSQKIISNIATTTNSKKIVNEILSDVAQSISDFAVEVLRGLKSFFISDENAEFLRQRKSLEGAISKISSYQGDDAEKYGEMLQQQLSKLGPVEAVSQAIEGIVFSYPSGSQNIYKLTGSFAMINQIVGRAKRLKEESDLSVIGESQNWRLVPLLYKR